MQGVDGWEMFQRMDLPPTADRIARMADLSTARSGFPAMKSEKKKMREKKKGFFFIFGNKERERQSVCVMCESGVAVEE